jgi:hypothetical protein
LEARADEGDGMIAGRDSDTIDNEVAEEVGDGAEEVE